MVRGDFYSDIGYKYRCMKKPTVAINIKNINGKTEIKKIERMSLFWHFEFCRINNVSEVSKSFLESSLPFSASMSGFIVLSPTSRFCIVHPIVTVTNTRTSNFVPIF